MQSPDSSLGFRASFAEEAKVIAEQLRGQGQADVSTIEAELPPPDLTFSPSFLDLPGNDQVQVQPSDGPLPPPARDPKQEPSLATASDQSLLGLKGLPALDKAASPANPGRWQLNVTMELCSLAPDAGQAGVSSSLAPQPSTEVNKTCVLSSGTPLALEAQLQCSQAPDDQTNGEGAWLEEQDRSNTPVSKTFLFSEGAFMTSTPQKASEGLMPLKGKSVFSICQSPPAQEAPSVAGAEQPSASHPQRPPAATGSPPKATPKSDPLGKVGQEKRSLGGASLAVSRRGHQAPPLLGQKRWSSLPFKTSGLPVLLKSRRAPLAPPGARQQKGRSSEAGRMKEAELPTKAGNNSPSATKVSELLRSKSVPPRSSLHQRGPSARDPKSRDLQPPRILKPVPPTQSTRSRAPSRTQEQPPKQDGKLQAPPGQTCPQCLVLQKQVEDLKSQLAAMQCLSGELHGLQGAAQDPSTANTRSTT